VRILRPGPIDAEQLAHVAGLPISAGDPGVVEAPGQLTQHYAPSKALRLEALQAYDDEWLIGFGPVRGDVSLSPTGNPVEAAARLFDLLHQADGNAAPAIAVAPIPGTGLGVAINDRLRRAAA
jgi:L-threonylcarbamoyladenylate synthase